MWILILIPIAYIIGFFTAIPIGATQIEITKRSLSGYTRQAIMVAIGSALSDLMYGLIAMFGVAPFLKEKDIIVVFWIISAVVLIVLGIFTLKNSKKSLLSIKESRITIKSNYYSFFIGFSLAVTNMPIMFWWLIVAEFIESIGIVTSFTTLTAFIYVASGVLGIFSYLIFLTLIMKKLGKFISNEFQYKLNIFLGVVLLVLSGYFIIKSILILY